MNVSLLLRELATYGVELESDGLSLPTPQWPKHCPSHLREAFVRNRRAIMSRIAPPVFVHIAARSLCETAATSRSETLDDAGEKSVCLALIDNMIVVWLPGLDDDCVASITPRLGLGQRGTQSELVKIVTDRKPPSILRRAARSGRAFCGWNRRNTEAAGWRGMGLPAPARWIELRELARAGGWREDFDELLWNLLLVRPAQPTTTPNYQHRNDVRSNMEVADYWATQIRTGLDHLLEVADLYDRLSQHDEPDLVDLHHAINGHGIGLDVELAQAVLSLGKEYAETQFSYIADATRGTMTVAQLLDDGYALSWLQSCGLRFPNLNAETIEWSLAQIRSSGLQHPPAVEAVLHARLMLARQPIGSLLRSINLVDKTGQIRDHMSYFVNRSGEFSCCGIAISPLIAAVNSHHLHWRLMCIGVPNLQDLVSQLPAYESIESVMAVMVADCFIAAENHSLHVCYWPDLKAEILCWMAGKRCRQFRWLNDSSIAEVRDALAEQVRRALEDGHSTDVGKCHFSFCTEAMEIRLPSGRALYYRCVEPFQCQASASFDEGFATSRPAPSLRDLLDANVVVDDIARGIGRDVVVAVLLSCAELGLKVVAHGPDFIVMEVASHPTPKDFYSQLDRMLERPKWAKGLPWNVTCVSSRRLGGGYGDWKRAQQDTGIGVPL